MSRPKPMHDALRVCIAISGGISAYKIPLLIRTLKKSGCEVKVIITRAAESLVGCETLRTLSKNSVYSDGAPVSTDIEHISLAQWAEVLCICPATANTIAKLAHGIADNLLTTMALAFEGSVLVAPAMNSAMWNKKVTQDNIGILERNGMRILPVGNGELACGTSGLGRMMEVEEIAEYVHAAARPQVLKGLKVLIASGPTAEHIDPVRVITNLSSGKMGRALASEALAMGADVTVVTGPAALPVPSKAKCHNVITALQMAKTLEKLFKNADVCIMAAAVSDYRIDSASLKKIKRTNGSLSIKLVPNPDILARLGEIKEKQILVGFALEDTLDIGRAQNKMQRKNCDLMILNTIGAALGKDTTDITMILKGRKPESTGPTDKKSAARIILERIAAIAGRTNV